jgi:ethanolamine utilization protein EutQ
MKEESTMASASEGIRLVRADYVETWYRRNGHRIFLADVLDPTNSDSMSVGFARYAPGESNEWIVTYDEALIVTKGAFTVTSADGIETTAHVGEVIFLRAGTPVVYSAKEGAEVVYVTYPHWIEAQEGSEHAALLDAFQPSEERPERSDARAFVDASFGPLEGGPNLDALAEDVVFTTAVGEIRGKQAVIGYFRNASATMEFDISLRPLEYFGDGDRVVQVGRELFRVKESGVTHETDFAWVFDVHGGRITRIVAIQDLSGVADEVADALDKAREATSEHAAPPTGGWMS